MTENRGKQEDIAKKNTALIKTTYNFNIRIPLKPYPTSA